MQRNTNILEINNLSVQVGDKLLLNNVNLQIPQGEVHALLGQNGSGKTTLLMTIMGFSEYKITQGAIFYNNQDITSLSINERAKLGIAIALQRPPTINGVTIHDILSFVLQDNSSKGDIITKITELANASTFLNRDINKGLSGGEIKRAELMQLLAIKPDFALIDEPDSGVDIETMTLIGQLVEHVFIKDEHHPALRRSGLIITHNCSVFDYFHVDKVHVMHHGQIICSGNPQLVIASINQNGYEGCVRCLEERTTK